MTPIDSLFWMVFLGTLLDECIAANTHNTCCNAAGVCNYCGVDPDNPLPL